MQDKERGNDRVIRYKNTALEIHTKMHQIGAAIIKIRASPSA
jgi:hypothetical protein